MKKIIAIAFAAVLTLFGLVTPAPAHAAPGTPELCAEADEVPEGVNCDGVIEGDPDVYPPLQPEGGETPEITFELLGPVCVGEFPFIQWRIAGTDLEPGATATITLSNDSGTVQVLTNQPLEGSVIWPGASQNPPDWPGWQLNSAGIWVEDPSDQILREGLTVTAEVNPTTVGEVSYPPASAVCADPENEPVPAPTVPPTGLPATGNSGANGMMQIGGLLLVGGLVVFVAARRRNPAGAA